MKLLSGETRVEGALAICLSIIADYLDGYGLLVFGTYVSFMSGNTTSTGLKIGQGHFDAALPFANRRSILRQRQFSGKSNDSVQIASFTSLDFRPDCRPSCDRCGSCSTWPADAPSEIAMLSVARV